MINWVALHRFGLPPFSVNILSVHLALQTLFNLVWFTFTPPVWRTPRKSTGWPMNTRPIICMMLKQSVMLVYEK